MTLRHHMPARDAAQSREDDDEVCDLDVIISRRVTFTFRGKVREILPITTQRLFAFWSAGQDCAKVAHATADESNRAFYEVIKTVCDDFTVEDASTMSVVQKAALLEHITRKVTGQKPLADDLKKKVMPPGPVGAP